ncbi:hypothetical protein [Sporosarcina sp. FA9]|uniref:hypothetical protein n=1 Tax=Sporosarcina sp. FA9 TaxID=3413030 RepID=UPI003F65BE3A
MLSKQGILKSILYGLLSGLFLTVFLKMVEMLTSNKVYTLLLNVDYFPFLNQYEFSEPVEVVFHLIISVALSVCLYILIIRLKINSRNKVIYLSTAVCFIVGIALFPTTALSNRTPSITDMSSIFFWLVGHILYGYILGFLLVKSVPKRK